MNTLKYIGMDVHMTTTVIAVANSVGRTVAEAVVETKTLTILDFLKSQRGTVHVTFEKGTQAAWLHDLIRPHVAEVVVCNPREIPAQENKADRSDAKRLAELLRTHGLKAVYHGEHGTQALKELSRSYGAILSDSTRVKNRLKGVFRGRGTACTGTNVYSKKGREQWLRKLDNSAVRCRISKLFKDFDVLVANGTRPSLVFLTLARKIASIVLALWKKGELYDSKKMKFMHAV